MSRLLLLLWELLLVPGPGGTITVLLLHLKSCFGQGQGQGQRVKVAYFRLRYQQLMWCSSRVLIQCLFFSLTTCITALQQDPPGLVQGVPAGLPPCSAGAPDGGAHCVPQEPHRHVRTGSLVARSVPTQGASWNVPAQGPHGGACTRSLSRSLCLPARRGGSRRDVGVEG